MKAVIFDYGGIVLDNPAEGLDAFCAKRLGVTKESFTSARLRHIVGFQKGDGEKSFWTHMCRELGVPLPIGSLWTEAVKSSFKHREEVLELVRRIKGRCKTALLSNTEQPVVDLFSRKLSAYFDVMVFSCVEKAVKPDAHIYEVALEKLGTQPEDTLFIDDVGEYVLAAGKLGIKAVQCDSPDDIRVEVERFL